MTRTEHWQGWGSSLCGSFGGTGGGCAGLSGPVVPASGCRKCGRRDRPRAARPCAGSRHVTAAVRRQPPSAVAVATVGAVGAQRRDACEFVLTRMLPCLGGRVEGAVDRRARWPNRRSEQAALFAAESSSGYGYAEMGVSRKRKTNTNICTQSAGTQLFTEAVLSPCQRRAGTGPQSGPSTAFQRPPPSAAWACPSTGRWSRPGLLRAF